MVRLVSALIVLALTTIHVAADEIKAISKIDTVTVFPRSAEIERSVSIELKSGAHTVTLNDLPAGAVADSVRVEGEADGDLAIGSVDARLVYVPESDQAKLDKAERRRLEQEIERLGDQRAELDGVIRVAEAQRALLQNLTLLPSRTGGEKSAARTREQWEAIYLLVGNRMPEVQKIILDSRIKQREIDRKIQDLRRQLSLKPPKQIRRLAVRIHLAAAADLTATLKVRYQVQGAGWAPIYDGRLVTSGKSGPVLTIQRQAKISQRTGEDWSNVRLLLSTTQPRKGTQAPKLRPIRVIFKPKPKPRPAAKPKKVSRRAHDGLGGTMSMEAARPASPATGAAYRKRLVRTVSARIVNAPFQAVYEVPGRHEIPTDGREKKVQIDSIATKATLRVHTVPKRAPTAFLYATFKLEGNARLLPGTISLFRDSVFVGRTRLAALSAKEEKSLGFGVDDQVRVVFAKLKQQTGESSGFISSVSTDTRQFKITVKNFHSEPVEVRVLDQIPDKSDEEIKVELTGNSTKPTKTNVDDKRGILAWDFKLAAGGEKVIQFGYRISWPRGKEVILVPAR